MLDREPACAEQNNLSTEEMYNRACELQAKGLIRESIAQYEALLAVQADHSEAHNDVGVLYYLVGDIDKALSHTRQALALAPAHVVARKNLADLYLALGQPEEARQQLRIALSDDPDDAEVLFALEQLCPQITDSGEAAVCSTRTPEAESKSRAQVLRSSAPKPSPRTEEVPCPFCGSTSALACRKTADVARCAACDIVYLRTRLTQEAMEEFYQSYADDDTYMAIPPDEKEASKSSLKRDGLMKEILEFAEPRGVLFDIGCGWGAFLLNARERGFRAKGIELTRRAVDFAVSTLAMDVTNVQFTDLPVDANSISIVTMLHVLEHLPQPKEAIEKVFDILEPGGMFCGIVPNIESLCSSVLGDKWAWLAPNNHYVHYSPTTLRRVMEDAGFVLERVYTATGDYNRAELRRVVGKVFDPIHRKLSEEDIRDIVARIEANGFGEEIRFFARKAPSPRLGAAGKSRERNIAVRADLTALKDHLHLSLQAARVEESAQLLQEILIRDPNDADALLAKGRLCSQAGHPDAARFFHERVLEIEPENVPARESLDELSTGAPDQSQLPLSP